MISGIWTRFLLNNRFAAIVDKKDLAYESQVLFAVENVAQFQYILKLDCHSFKAFRYSRGLQPLILLNTLE